MQDRHLFRGKVNNYFDNGKWALGWLNMRLRDGDLSQPEYDAFIRVNYDISDRGEITDIIYPVDPATIGQCTGLKDKNGKLIFEGDILKVSENELKYHPDSNKKCVIIFGHYRHSDASLDYVCGDYGFYLDWISDKHKLLRNDLIYWQGNSYIEIIGTIHDNYELLMR